MISSQKYVENRQQYLIDSWVDLSCLLYDPQDKDLTLEEKKDLRFRMLTTIKGYDYLHQNSPAIIDVFDIPEDVGLLKLLDNIKYIIRQDYVTYTPKNYIKFLNLTREILVNELKNIDIRKLDVSHMKTDFDKDINIDGYNLACMNCIHFPDPNVEAIQRDLEILDSHSVLTKKIIL